MRLPHVSLVRDAKEMNTMTARQLEILQHALGCDRYGQSARRRGEVFHPDYDPYSRNRFCAGAGDETDCRALVEMGLMEEHPRTEWLPYFNCSVTEAGIKAMRDASPAPPKKTRSQLRFEAYRRFSDAYECSFREFLRISKTDWYRNMKSSCDFQG